MLRWIVQTNLGQSDDIDQIRQVCDDNGYEFEGYAIIPFSTRLPNIPVNDLAIFYGSSNFVNNAYRAHKWTPGVFFDEKLFTITSLIDHLGDNALNNSALITTVKEFNESDFGHNQPVFVRPNKDLKEFSGYLTTTHKLAVWCDQLQSGDFLLDGDTEIVVARPQQLDVEWRLFIVDRKVISASQYRVNADLDMSPEVPSSVIDYAEKIAKQWSPVDVYVMDVAEVQGVKKVIEFNGFNSSGFYSSDIPAIIKAVSEHVLSKHAEPAF